MMDGSPPRSITTTARIKLPIPPTASCGPIPRRSSTFSLSRLPIQRMAASLVLTPAQTLEGPEAAVSKNFPLPSTSGPFSPVAAGTNPPVNMATA